MIRLKANGSAGEFIKKFNEQNCGLTAAIDRDPESGRWDLIFFKSTYKKERLGFWGKVKRFFKK